MVGETDKSILPSRKSSGRTNSEGQQGTYSRRKKDKKAKFHADDEKNANSNENYEHHAMVDLFVQDIIERAKNEYLSQSVNHHNGDDGVTVNDCLIQKHPKDKNEDKKRPGQHKSSKTPGKDKHKHRHHYKYSDTVDAKDISQYEQLEDTHLQLNPRFGQVDPHRDNDNRGFYNRTRAAFRRMLGCCLGKT